MNRARYRETHALLNQRRRESIDHTKQRREELETQIAEFQQAISNIESVLDQKSFEFRAIQSSYEKWKEETGLALRANKARLSQLKDLLATNESDAELDKRIIELSEFEEERLADLFGLTE